MPKPLDTAQFKHLLTRALEEDDQFVCHDDIPDATPLGFDAHFTACGEDEETFLVCILKVDL